MCFLQSARATQASGLGSSQLGWCPADSRCRHVGSAPSAPPDAGGRGGQTGPCALELGVRAGTPSGLVWKVLVFSGEPSAEREGPGLGVKGGQWAAGPCTDARDRDQEVTFGQSRACEWGTEANAAREGGRLPARVFSPEYSANTTGQACPLSSHPDMPIKPGDCAPSLRTGEVRPYVDANRTGCPVGWAHVRSS